MIKAPCGALSFLLNYEKCEAKKNDHPAEQHTVEAVEHSAVPGQKLAHILDIALAFYRAFEQVASLRRNRGYKTYESERAEHFQIDGKRAYIVETEVDEVR